MIYPNEPEVLYLGTYVDPRSSDAILAFIDSKSAQEWAEGEGRILWPVIDVHFGEPKVSTIITERRLVPLRHLDEQQRVNETTLAATGSQHEGDGTPGPASRRRLVRRLEDTAGPDDIDNTVFDPDEREAAKVHLANADEVTGVRRVI